MLTDTQLLQLYQHFHLSKKAMAVIKSICSSELPPHARSARGNFSGRYPSRKMKSSIQLESRQHELPYIYQIEHDNKVLECYDQPS
jgi:putative transposase